MNTNNNTQLLSDERRSAPGSSFRSWFTPNLGAYGRVVRALAGAALVVAGMLACSVSNFVSIPLILAGGFVLYEAARGWCVFRACGIKTKI